LRIQKGLESLRLLEDAVLDTGLVGAYTFHHQAFVIFTKAFSTHGGVGHPPANKNAVDDGDAAVDEEEHLPGLESASLDEREAVRQKAADNLL
jgi:hypothetical protein